MCEIVLNCLHFCGNILTLGRQLYIAHRGTGATAAANAAKAAASASTKAASTSSKIATGVKKTYEVYSEVKHKYDLVDKSIDVGTGIDENIKAGQSADVTALEATKAALDVAALLDPTGTAATIAAYTYPKCSAYFGEPPAVETAVDVTATVLEVEAAETDHVKYEERDDFSCQGSEGNVWNSPAIVGCKGYNLKNGKCRYSKADTQANLLAKCKRTCSFDKYCDGFSLSVGTCYYRKGKPSACKRSPGSTMYFKK